MTARRNEELPGRGAPLPSLITANIAAAVVAAAATPTVGPIAGALAGAALQPVFELLAERDRRAARRSIAMVEQALELAGMSPADAVDWADELDPRLELLANAVTAAWNTNSEQKIQALARVLAEGLHDDARIDALNLIVLALKQLEAPHIRVLHTMIHEQNGADTHAGVVILTDDDAPPPDASAVSEWSVPQLGERHPQLADGMASIIATLGQTGCVAAGAPRLADSVLAEFPAGAPWTWWVATTFGVGCLNHLESVQQSHAL